MSLQSIVISGYKSGAVKNKKPFLLTDDAFAELNNAYCYREEIRKREGLQFIGRFRRYFFNDSIGNSGASPWSFNIYSTLAAPITPEDNAEIEAGSVIVYIGASTTTGNITGYTIASDAEVTSALHGLSTGDQVEITDVVVVEGSGPDDINNKTYTIEVTSANTFKLGVSSLTWGTYSSGGTWTHPVAANQTLFDQGNGTLATDPVSATTGIINYLTGDVTLTGATAGVAAAITFGYYPALPAMGIKVREIPGINAEQTIWFDTRYSYIHDGANFQEFLAADNVTWNGTDSDFFWATNYRGSEPQDRLFFVTNFVNNAGSPMRYTDGNSWELFQPIIGGTEQEEVLSTTVAAGAVAFADTLTNLPIVEGTVVITVGDNEGIELDVVFRDTPKDGTLISTGLNSGTINYATGDITLAFNPALPGSGTWTVTAVYSQAGNFLFTARVLIPYYGRLLAMNTYEGTSHASAVNIYNRCRFSQVGSPIQQDAWRSDTFGKGGFIDAPVNEDIISATFYKNTLIVRFERSTWRLQYIGEYGTPFIWERISSDFGSESTFSAVLFDNGVLDVGDKAITGSSGNDVQRIDLDIPDTVYAFKNADNGVKRVHGIRDFKKELVFWCYPDYPTLETNQYFPNRTLVYNYRNNTFAFFRNNVTCFGNFQYPANITWDRLDVFWDSYEVLWDGGIQENYPLIASANQQGFAHFFGYPDAETSVDSTISANDQESLAVTNVTVTTVVTLEIHNHNLRNEEVIYLAGLIYLDGSVEGSTTLNDQIYFVQKVDEDNIVLFKYNPDTGFLFSDFSVTNVGDYIGGGVVALFPKIEIVTKDFNPAKQAGYNIKTSYIDFLFDVSSPASINIFMKMNTDANNQGNLLIGNKNVETSNSKTGYITDVTLANPCVIESKNHSLLDGDSIGIQAVLGTTELNGNSYTTTFIDVDHFSIGVDSTAYTPYVSGGFWEQDREQFWSLSSQYTWHRFFATTFGQYVTLIMSYNNEQMSQLSTHQQNFVLNAMQLYYLPGGKNIFGK